MYFWTLDDIFLSEFKIVCLYDFLTCCIYHYLISFFVIVIHFNLLCSSRAILTEYAGLALGVLSAVLFGKRGQIWKKVVSNLMFLIFLVMQFLHNSWKYGMYWYFLFNLVYQQINKILCFLYHYFTS